MVLHIIMLHVWQLISCAAALRAGLMAKDLQKLVDAPTFMIES
jgi:hypothetical protein